MLKFVNPRLHFEDKRVLAGLTKFDQSLTGAMAEFCKELIDCFAII